MRKKNNQREIKTGFGDSRHEKRFRKICEDISSNLAGTIPQINLTKSSTKGMYRFFSNEQITPDRIISAHQQDLMKRLNSGNSNR